MDLSVVVIVVLIHLFAKRWSPAHGHESMFVLPLVCTCFGRNHRPIHPKELDGCRTSSTLFERCGSSLASIGFGQYVRFEISPAVSVKIEAPHLQGKVTRVDPSMAIVRLFWEAPPGQRAAASSRWFMGYLWWFDEFDWWYLIDDICGFDCESADMKSGERFDRETLKGLSDPELSPIAAALPVEAAHLDDIFYYSGL